MRAFRTATLTGPTGLRLDEVPAPSPGPEEIRVRVRATALNRADLLQTLGLYPAPPGVSADIPGLEYSGEVAEVGARVRRWKVGDRVMGLVSGGAWAEQVVTHEREAMPMPSKFDFAQAAAIPEAFITAFDALVLQGGVTVGTTVLIHAVASGVGTAALQICNALGSFAIGTGRTAAKLQRAMGLGLTESLLISRDEPSFAARVRALTHGHGADVVLDLVGGSWLPESLETMAPRGTLMLVGLMAGAAVEVPLRMVLGKRLRIQGTTLRARGLEERIMVAQQFEQRLLPLFERGRLVPVIDATFPMLDLVPALERLAANDSFGKLVLTW